MADFGLPARGFKWLTRYEKDSLDVMNIADDSDIGYILVVGLKIPVENHDLYDQFPLCPDNVVIGEGHVSTYTRKLYAACGIQLRTTKKPCLSLTDKTHSAVQYRTLQSYICLGVVLKRFHKVIRFTQSLWLKDFMKYTTDKRSSAINDFDKMVYKSVACNVLGKSIQSVKSRSMLELSPRQINFACS